MAKNNNYSGLSKIFNKAKKISSNRKRTAIIIVLFLVVGYFGYTKLLKQPPMPQYQTTQVEKGTLISTVSASGQVLTTNMVNVTTSASGVVKEVWVKDGDTVQAGQKVMEVTLDLEGQTKNAQAYSSYLSAKNNLDATNANAYSLRSTKDTAWKKFYDLATSSQYQNSDGSPREDQRNSSAEFQSAQGDWLAAEAKYNNQQAVIAQSKQSITSAWLAYQQTSPQVYAPISGTISNITQVPGMTLSQTSSGTNAASNSGQRTAVVKNEGMPTATFNFSEVDISKVKIDQGATITLDAIPSKTFAGKVASVDHIGTVTGGVTNYQVLISFQTKVPEILPNMAASANIITDTKDDVLKVSTSAIQTSGGQTTVRILQNGTITSTSVETGLSSDSETEITNGLSEGQTVVTGVVQPATSGGQTTSPFGSFGRQGGGFSTGGGAGRLQGGGR